MSTAGIGLENSLYPYLENDVGLFKYYLNICCTFMGTLLFDFAFAFELI